MPNNTVTVQDALIKILKDNLVVRSAVQAAILSITSEVIGECDQVRGLDPTWADGMMPEVHNIVRPAVEKAICEAIETCVLNWSE